MEDAQEPDIEGAVSQERLPGPDGGPRQTGFRADESGIPVILGIEDVPRRGEAEVGVGFSHLMAQAEAAGDLGEIAVIGQAPASRGFAGMSARKIFFAP